MEEMMVSTAAKMLIGVSLHTETSLELLSWATGVAARTNDTVIALHVLLGRNETKQVSVKFERTKMRRAKAFVISMLGEFTELCQSKQVKLEAKVIRCSSIGEGLVEEAALVGANFLVIGGLKNQSQRSLEISKYCFNHAPKGCLVIGIRRGNPPQDSKTEFLPYEGFCPSRSTKSKKENRMGVTSMQKHFTSKMKRDSLFHKSSPTDSIYEKPSPRTVLDGPEGRANIIEEDSFSLADSSVNEFPLPLSKFNEFNYGISNPSLSKRWKNISGIKHIFPFFRSQFEGNVKSGRNYLSNIKIRQSSWRCFSYEEITQATNNFHPDNMVGKGGYAEVFRGDLWDGRIIAVKRLAKDNTDETKEKEFLTELGIIGHVCHPNTSFLLGCCVENGLHLIFNFSPNGTLASALHGKSGDSLEWSVRYKIVLGIARGLHYLHKCCKHRIIHRDIKASNVLLGSDFEPQISDFGLAKWLPKHWTHHSVIPIEGTFGYLAPEYFMHGIVDEKTDIYAFGVLLLEIITGRKPIDSSKQSLLLWAKPLMDSGNIIELADPKLGCDYNMEQMQRLVLTASYCVRQSSIWRPSMSQVLQLIIDGCDSMVARNLRTPEYNHEELDDDYTTEISCHYLTSPDLEEDY